ncbi:aurofusarin biosynthesis regulatory protein aurR1 [Colletotrichum liriopes]|uniref:Aurofusarin biosynthesis regulatory protein aurR1 n=1 Tax=Colletotrichum liriopes TaxID=708192 RepID=A0AA37LXD3_9PEZI|nr:aurofusarin biosynthesis regulatory protein aurR1 [Colletotrichum liriopes]
MNTSAPLPRPVETFRESCDNCAKSKVRCGKEQPWCQRCARRGQVCSYSPSQRSRKRTFSAAATENERWTGTLPETSLGHSSVSTTPSSHDDAGLLPQPDGGLGPYSDLVGLLTRDSSTDSLTADNANNLFWLSDMESGGGGGEERKGSDRVDSLMFPDDDGVTTAASRAMGIIGGAPFDYRALRLMGSTADRQHCEADVISALAKLDLPSSSCQGSSRSLRNLGTILTASRSALSSASKAVSCTCAPNANVALLVTADAMSSLFVPPMTIGAYELDAENQERMIGHIVLSELGKMGRLLDSFSHKFCGPQSIATGNDSRNQLHMALEMFIRNKYSVMVVAAKSKSDEK